MKDVAVVSKTIPANPRSDNYQVGTTVVRTSGGTAVIAPGGGDSVDILKENDNRSLTDTNVMSSVRAAAEFISRKNDGSVKALVDYLNGIKINGTPVTKIIQKATEVKEYSDTDVMSALRVMDEIINRDESIKKLFLSKATDDRTDYSLEIGKNLTVEGLIKALGGIEFGDFAEGISGFGGKINQFGSAWLDSLSIRKFLEVPELRYNRISIEVGNSWNAPGGGVIERAVPDYDAGGNILNTGTIVLHLQDKEIGKVAVDDICQGIFRDGMTLDNNFSDDYDDGIGNFRFSGFYTCYFRITEVLEVGRNSKFRYMLRGISDRWRFLFHPCEAMHFVGYGNFTDKSRQTSRYSTRTYERYLRNVNGWEFTADNIGAQFGDLSNLSIFGMNMEGYSAFLNNIYMTGVVEQLENYPVRIEIDTKGDNFLSFGETMELICRVFKGWSDITDTVTKWIIIRDSGDTANDEAWAIKNKNFAGAITLAYEDLGDNAATSVSTLFTITATTKANTAKAIINI